MTLPPLIPRRQFFDNPERTGVQISPDGTKLSYLAPENGRLNVWVRTIGLEDDVCVTHDTARGIQFYFWARDGKRILYIQDQGGNENFHLYAADLSDPSAESKDLTPFENVRVVPLDNPRATPSKVLIQMNRRHPALFDVHRLDIETGEIEDVAENPGDIAGWQIDAQAKVRAAGAQTPDGGWELRVRDTEADEFRTLAVYSNEDELNTYGFTKDGKGLYVGTAKDAEFKRLLKLDVATGDSTVVDFDDEADLSNAFISDKTKELWGAVYVKDEAVLHAFDEQLKTDWARLKELHAGDPNLTGVDDEETTFIVAYDDDVDPGAHYAYDRASGQATFLWRSRPWLDPAHLAPMKPVQFDARDGLRLHAYLTLPVGLEPANLPLVLLVHGGPWARDTWGYVPDVQFLANRGYAVLQVNFRGSTGYGKKFKEAAVREWAGKMHDDLIDAVNWAIDKGYADPKRVGIYGGSYGGYAALVGVTYTPDVFAAACSYCGPSNLLTLLSSFPEYWKPILSGTFFKHIGNLDVPEDVEEMKARSPLFKADLITTPLLVVQGANDVRVTKVESDQIVEALRSRGIDVDYIVKDDEGHGFQNPENKLEMYAALERFFAKHLGGRFEE